MVKKETIGKIQLTMGILLLIAGMVGLVIAYNLVNQQFENLNEINRQVNPEIINDLDSPLNTYRLIAFSIWANFSSVLAGTSILLIFISSLFITQGLVNMSETKKQTW